MHQTLLLEQPDTSDVNGTPGAAAPARSEANRVAGLVDAPSNAIDPAEAESGVHGFRPSDAGFTRVLLIEAHDQVADLVVMGFEPGTELRWCWKECWFWRHCARIG